MWILSEKQCDAASAHCQREPAVNTSSPLYAYHIGESLTYAQVKCCRRAFHDTDVPYSVLSSAIGMKPGRTDEAVDRCFHAVTVFWLQRPCFVWHPKFMHPSFWLAVGQDHRDTGNRPSKVVIQLAIGLVLLSHINVDDTSIRFSGIKRSPPLGLCISIH